MRFGRFEIDLLGYAGRAWEQIRGLLPIARAWVKEQFPWGTEPETSPSSSGPISSPGPERTPAHLEAHAEPPDEVIYAVGDIHGRADLVEALIEKIEDDIAEQPKEGRLVFLGDYIDRGLQSKQVIDFLLSERVQKLRPIFIKGNHEDAFLNFLSNPQHGPIWAKYGGRETLVSYGIRPPRSMSFNDDWIEAHKALQQSLPPSHERFLMSLQLSVRLGPYGFVHAGVKPGVPFEDQNEEDLLWIRDEFLRSKNGFDVMVIHGHTPVDQATNSEFRVNVDTGAYYSGRLTAARISGQEISFISTRP